MQLPIFIVDAFSSVPFSGNPAAVCLLGPGVVLSDETRQKIAAEMNLSETAFVEPVSWARGLALEQRWEVRAQLWIGRGRAGAECHGGGPHNTWTDAEHAM